MHILLLSSRNLLYRELSEMVNELSGPPYVADSYTEAWGILASQPIEAVIFTLRTLADLEFLQYLNTSHPQIRVFLNVEGALSDIVRILKDGRYQVFPSSYRLPEMKRGFEAVIRSNDENCDKIPDNAV